MGQPLSFRLTRPAALGLAVALLAAASGSALAQDRVDDFRLNCTSCHTIGGGRLVGRVGDWDIGVLSLQTGQEEFTTSSGAKQEVASENFSVVRLKRQTAPSINKPFVLVRVTIWPPFTSPTVGDMASMVGIEYQVRKVEPLSK